MLVSKRGAYPRSGRLEPGNCSSRAKRLNEYRSAIEHHGLPRAVFLLHEEKIGARDLACLADASHERTLANALVQVLPVSRIVA
jgi:hypothetical protein